ncbi:myb-related transcription factor, partner of profilin-like [Ischnura elegans]|uniref:myb-related transcription factor, partner of profilin-like n=1 Tax=Ischnura elegans TaxID=197161 RepID=UPI001ED88E07|nr:myb-related transcription factor, partner of profilin-like [Ischnura elegans]
MTAMADQTAETVAAALVRNWILRFGVPKTILTDQGTNFESELFRSIPPPDLGRRRARPRGRPRKNPPLPPQTPILPSCSDIEFESVEPRGYADLPQASQLGTDSGEGFDSPPSSPPDGEAPVKGKGVVPPPSQPRGELLPAERSSLPSTAFPSPPKAVPLPPPQPTANS